MPDVELEKFFHGDFQKVALADGPEETCFAEFGKKSGRVLAAFVQAVAYGGRLGALFRNSG